MQFEELAEVVKTRRSVRRFADREVPDDLINRALELAVWAPNGGNRQSWGFYVIKNRAQITAVADAVKAKTELMAAWPEADGFGETINRWRRTSDFFRSAPVLIAVTMGKYESIADRVLDTRGDGDPQAAEIMAARRTGSSRLQSVAAAIAIMILALHQQGLGSTWMAGPQQAKAEIEAMLKVPGDMDFIALVPVGFPAEAPTPGPRRPTGEVVHFLR